jgi:putative glutamine amidotransferase
MRPKIAITASAQEARQSDARATYRSAVEHAGGDPQIVADIPRGSVAEALCGFDGLLIPGGFDVDPAAYGGRPHPTVQIVPADRDALELEAARFAKRSGLPTLAICRGMQVVNVALGGTLYEDIDDQYDRRGGPKIRHDQRPDFNRKDVTHDVDVSLTSRLASIVGAACVRTNSLHHQAVRRVAYCFEVTARARDGIVEALELRGEHPFFVGVQWHPEELVDTDAPSRRLFETFVAAAAARAGGRRAVAGR